HSLTHTWSSTRNPLRVVNMLGLVSCAIPGRMPTKVPVPLDLLPELILSVLARFLAGYLEVDNTSSKSIPILAPIPYDYIVVVSLCGPFQGRGGGVDRRLRRRGRT